MRFSEFTELMRQSLQPDKENIRKKVLATAKPKWIKGTAILCVIAIIIGLAGTAGFFLMKDAPRGKADHLPDNLKGLSTIAAITTSAQSDRIPTDSTFEITTVKSAKVEDVQAALSVSPNTDYTIKKTSGNTFSLKFDTELKANTVYNLKSTSGGRTVFSWAFQTENKFEITAFSPSGGSVGESSSVWVEFSHIGVSDFEKYFSITPAVPGEFKEFGKRHVFIPSEPFEPSVVYTVAISKDIKNTDGQTLEKDCVFSFSLRADSYLEYDYYDMTTCETFLTTQEPAARVRFEDVYTDTATVDVYGIESADEFIRIHRKYTGDGLILPSIESELKTRVMTFEAEPVTVEGAAYFKYPDTLPGGYYVATITFEHGTVYHIFQVTDMAVYTVSSNGNCTVWVNDTKTESAAAGIAVTEDGGDISATDKDGIAIIPDNNKAGLRYFKIGSEAPYVAIVSNSEGDDYTDTALDLYSFITSDSTVYKPGDKIKVWGTVIKRRECADKDYEIYCSLDGKTRPITVGKDGVFTAEFEVSEYETEDGGYIDIIADGTVVTSRYFTVANYTLPTYQLTITTDKDEYLEGDTVTYTVYAELFDRTPAEGVSVFVGETEITTNSRGLTSFTEIATVPDDMAYAPPYHHSVEFYVVQPDGESVFYHADTKVFPSKTHISDITDNGTHLSVKTQGYDGKKADNADITAELHRVTYEKTENGFAYFDPVTMENVPIYSYEANDEVILSEEYTAKKGLAEIPYKTEDDGAAYYVKLICGKNEYTHYVSGSEFAAPTEYSFMGEERYSVGDTVSLSLSGGIDEGKVMVSTVAGDIITCAVYAPNDVSFEFTKDYCPDALVAGAYFDGTSLTPIDIKWIFEKERRLEVEITADKKSYSPGDTVNLSISVTDENGLPTAANLCVGVTDKALYTLCPDYTDIYSDMHYSRSHLAMLKRTVSTHLPYPITDAYGEGGGGGDAVRTDFEDTPYFESVTVDGSGTATASFTLPDSITTWVVRARAFNSTAAAGQADTEIISTKDMFITSYVAEVIDPDDEASFAFRFNSKKAEDKAEYTVTLTRDGKKIKTLDGEAAIGQVKNESFGKLKEGDYSVVISGESGKYSDSVGCEFSVKATEVTDVTVEKYALGKSIDSYGYESDVTVSIYDREYDFYYTVLTEMLKKTSSRIDHKIAHAAAISQLGGNGGAFNVRQQAEIGGYITQSGINIYSADGYTTPLQTALITAVLGERVSTSDICIYFEDIMANEPDSSTVIAYCLAFAAMGEPVLDELNTTLTHINTLTDEQKAYLALGFAYAGDYRTATDIFEKELTDKILTANGVSKFSADSPYETEYMTCITACLASKVSSERAKGLIKSLINGEDYTVSGLAMCVFTENCLPTLKGENEVEYTAADGSKKTLTYSRTQSKTVKIAKADLDKVRFTAKKGESVMTVTGEVGERALKDAYKQNEDVSIDLGADEMTVNDGDRFTLLLEIDAQECAMTSPRARLMLPHGIKVIKTEITSEGGYSICGQDKRYIDVYPVNGIVSLEVECYGALEGEYVIHAPMLTDRESGQYAVGDDIEITVK